jgi:hypothetical protein
MEAVAAQRAQWTFAQKGIVVLAVIQLGIDRDAAKG